MMRHRWREEKTRTDRTGASIGSDRKGNGEENGETFREKEVSTKTCLKNLEPVRQRRRRDPSPSDGNSRPSMGTPGNMHKNVDRI